MIGQLMPRAFGFPASFVWPLRDIPRFVTWADKHSTVPAAVHRGEVRSFMSASALHLALHKQASFRH